MNIKDNLIKYQPSVYQTLLNAKKNNRFSHAYLLSASYGMPLIDFAIYIAQSILCDNGDPLACLNCPTCLRIAEKNYADLLIEDGSKEKIKKQQIDNIERAFVKTALENKGKMIYILHLVENATPIALNSLLKFLEEPNQNVYAILTTYNENKVLPTILSRTQILHLSPIPRLDVINHAINNGVAIEDAELLSSIYNDDENLKDFSSSETYKKIKSLLLEFLEEFINNKDYGNFIMEKKIIPQIKSYEQVEIFFDLLLDFLYNLMLKKIYQEIVLKSYVKIIDGLENTIINPQKTFLEILEAKKAIDININIPLLFDYLLKIL